MRHKNSVKQLGRTYSHRTAMLNNMVTSLFTHERIVTTKEKGKVLKKLAEKLITRAKKNLDSGVDSAAKLHNKREVMKRINDRDVVKKLFDDIAGRNKDRNGGYTRLLLLGKRRPGDAAEMAIVELVERVVVEKKEKPEKEEKAAKTKKDKKEKKDKKDKKAEKADKKAKEKE